MSSPAGNDAIEKLDASFTESPYLSPANHRQEVEKANEQSVREVRSKAYESAIINLDSNLPLPSAFYQNHHYRIFYNDLLPKHTPSPAPVTISWITCRTVPAEFTLWT